MKEKVVAAGELIYSEGDPGTALYLVQEGKVEVLRALGNDQVRLAILGRGEIFGETSVIRGTPHGTTMRAVDRTRLAVVPKDDFLNSLSRNNAFQLLVLRTLCDRLSNIDEPLLDRHLFSGTARVGEVAKMRLLPASLEMLTQIGEAGQPVDIDMPLRVGSKFDQKSVTVSKDLCLEPVGGKAISPTHFAIEARNGRVVLHDLGSRLGTLVNGQLVAHFELSQYADLRFGENEIQIGPGDSPFRFRLIIERTLN